MGCTAYGSLKMDIVVLDLLIFPSPQGSVLCYLGGGGEGVFFCRIIETQLDLFVTTHFMINDKNVFQDLLLNLVQGWDKGWPGWTAFLGAMVYCRDGGTFLYYMADRSRDSGSDLDK